MARVPGLYRRGNVVVVQVLRETAVQCARAERGKQGGAGWVPPTARAGRAPR